MAKRLKENKYMYRNEFAAALAGQLGVSKEAADEAAAAFMDVLARAWRDGRSVCFPNFGVFELHIITEKMGRNPKTMEQYLIPVSYKPAFRPTKGLREAVSQAIEAGQGEGAAS